MRIKFLFISFLLLFVHHAQAKFPTCSDMRSCEEAYEYLRQGYTKLDRDRDGVPCESICGAN